MPTSTPSVPLHALAVPKRPMLNNVNTILMLSVAKCVWMSPRDVKYTWMYYQIYCRQKNHMTMVELGEGTSNFSGWREEKGSFFCKDIGVYISSNKVLGMS